MQAWGTQSRFRYRDTGLEPSKSGVIGLLCAALGRPRWQPVDDLARLRFGVRVDSEGALSLDYHTVGARYVAGRLPGAQSAFASKGKLENGIISHRYYLADAVFLAGIEGQPAELELLRDAVRSPVWQLCLGRKSFPPAEPVWLPDGLREEPLEDALEAYAPLVDTARGGSAPRRFVVDAANGSEVRNDLPLSFADRSFAARRVRTYYGKEP